MISPILHNMTCISKNCDVYGKEENECCFLGRMVSIFIMVIPHIITHIGLGAITGLKVGAVIPTDFLNHHCKKIENSDSKLRAFCRHVCTFSAVMLGTIIAVPGLLLGTVIGLGRSLYLFPNAVQTCWNDGVCTALFQMACSY